MYCATDLQRGVHHDLTSHADPVARPVRGERRPDPIGAGACPFDPNTGDGGRAPHAERVAPLRASAAARPLDRFFLASRQQALALASGISAFLHDRMAVAALLPGRGFKEIYNRLGRDVNPMGLGFIETTLEF